MRRLRLKNLFEINNFNYIFIYKKKHHLLNNYLKDERLNRYNQAYRDVTKDKILSGSFFLYRCFKTLGFTKEICLKAFSTASSYRIMLPRGDFSYSNSGDYHVLTFSLTDKTGVDIEEYRDRPEITYKRFLSYSDESQNDLKLLFYKKWLAKEILFKQNQVKSISYFHLDNYICGYSFSSTKKTKLFYLPNLLEDNFAELNFSMLE